jgi:galactose-1-phosphate uridylyltransferase
MRDPEYLDILADGTVKQINPFSGTEVWTVARRGARPIRRAERTPTPLDPALAGAHCVFCERRYTDTPPEKARLIASPSGTPETRPMTMASQLFATTAEFRRVPNLFEILSFDYWRANYGYELPADLREHARAYVAEPEGRAHVAAVAAAKLRASGEPDATPGDADILAAAEAFFGSTHDLIVARRHYPVDAVDDAVLAGSGTLTPAEHRRLIAFTVAAMRDLYWRNRYARYVSVFQNWLRPAGASLDHLHKQLVAIDAHGAQYELAVDSLRANPEAFNERAANYAAYKNLVIAENDWALAFAGYGHRYPTVEVFSKSEAPDPWHHTPEELAGMADLLHAMHAATGPDIPTNEEWHSRPVDATLPMPWRIVLKWRISTVAGFEGATKIYLNTIDPYALRDRLVPELFRLRAAGAIAPEIRIATEASCRPNPLAYTANRGGPIRGRRGAR